jgi:thiamine pyrophosphokinase
MVHTALVFGGAPVVATQRLRSRLAELPEPFVVAADAGAETALRLGFVPDVVLGDFDSIAPAALADLKERGVTVESYPTDKDATDGELAIQRALATSPRDLVLVGFLGGPRLDQELANVLLLTVLTAPAVLVDGPNECRLLRSGESWAWTADPNELVSLLPLAGDARGVRTRGLRWALDGDTLVAGQTRGVSNAPVQAQVSVSLDTGLLLVTRHFPSLGYDAAGMGGLNLRTPGPTPLPPEVREALARDMVNHRGAEFASVLRDCVDGLKWAFQTNYDMLVLTASGTGGLESVVVNTLSPGEKALVVTVGYFGDRVLRICRAYGVDVADLGFEWGRAADPQAIANRLAEEPAIDTVLVTHNETSTGVLNPVREIAEAVRRVRPEALLVVDGISSVGSTPICPEEWGLDVVVAGSQKGWMIPPGLAFVAVSPRAWQRVATSRLPRVYFDWSTQKQAQEKGSTPATPAVSLLFALQAALKLMRAEGLDTIFERHARLAAYTRRGLADLGLRLLVDERFASPTVTTAWLPDGVDGKQLLRTIRERHNVDIPGGQGKLEGKILRIGHLGWVTEADIAEALQALKVELDAVANQPAPPAGQALRP